MEVLKIWNSAGCSTDIAEPQQLLFVNLRMECWALISDYMALASDSPS